MPSSMIIRRTNYARLVQAFPTSPGAYDPRRSINLQPSTTFPAGQVLGISGVAANAVQTQTTTGTPTGGTITDTVVDPLSGESTTFTFAFDAAASAVQTAIRAAIGNSDVAVTGGPSPGTALVFTFSGRYASRPVYPMTADVTAATGGTNTASTFAQTTVGRTALTYGKYVGGSATDPAKCLLEYACVTDAAGYATPGDAAWAGAEELQISVPAFFGGAFFVEDLTGLDAGAVVDLGGKLESGTVSSRGVLRF
jgi:hypothetical protein